MKKLIKKKEISSALELFIKACKDKQIPLNKDKVYTWKLMKNNS